MDQEHTWIRPLIPEDEVPTEDLQAPLYEDLGQEPEQAPETIEASTEAPEELSGWERARKWVKGNKGKLAMGAAALSVAATVAYNPLGEVTQDLVEAAPWVGAGLVTSEAMFAGGLVMMASSVGSSVRNPLKIRDKLPEICRQANDSLLFKSGFWVNTVGAVGSAAIIAGGIIAKMPPESYGLLSFSAMDLAVTVAVRKAMMTGIKNRSAEQSLLKQEA